MRKHLESHGVKVELGTEPVSLEQDADGVTVTLKKTSPEANVTSETLRVAYVVGCDGARGEIRHTRPAGFTLISCTGMTRKFIGATFEGQTMEGDGGVWAECDLETLERDFVSRTHIHCEHPAVLIGRLALPRLAATWHQVRHTISHTRERSTDRQYF